MIRTATIDGVLVIHVDGESSHLSAKQLSGMLGRVCGRGQEDALIDGQRVRIVVSNQAADHNGGHTAIEDR